MNEHYTVHEAMTFTEVLLVCKCGYEVRHSSRDNTPFTKAVNKMQMHQENAAKG